MQLSGPSVAKVLNRVASDVSRDTGKVVGAAALAAKKVHLVRLAADTGGDLRLSGVGAKGAKLGVKYTVLGDSAVIQATGPAHLIERSTKAHRIGPRKRRRGIVIPGVGVRAYAHHPGTAGKATWAKGRLAAWPKIRKEMRQGIFSIVKKAAHP